MGKGGSQRPMARSGGQWAYYIEHLLPGPCYCCVDIYYQEVSEGTDRTTKSPCTKILGKKCLWKNNVRKDGD